MHLRMPSIDQGVQAFLWAFTFFLYVWLGSLAVGFPGGTSFVIALLVGARASSSSGREAPAPPSGAERPSQRPLSRGYWRFASTGSSERAATSRSAKSLPRAASSRSRRARARPSRPRPTPARRRGDGATRQGRRSGMAAPMRGYRHPLRGFRSLAGGTRPGDWG